MDLIALIAGLFLSCTFVVLRLAKASQHVSNGIQCLHNARRLAFAAHLYASDNRDLWPANGNSDLGLNLENPPPQYIPRVWIEGSENLFSKQQADGTISPKVSLLAQYIPDRRTLRGPGDTHLLRFGNALFARPRNYSMNLFIAWPQSAFAQTWHGEPMGKNQIFSKISATLKPDYLFLFGEVHSFSICQPAFGTHPTWDAAGNAAGSNRSFHVPADFHGRASVFSMADGHTEMHHWINPRFNDPYLANGQRLTEVDPFWHIHDAPLPGVPAQTVLSDFKWLAEHATVPK